MKSIRPFPSIRFSTLLLLLPALWLLTRFQAQAARPILPSADLSGGGPQPYLEFEIYNGHVIEDPQLPPVLPSGRVDYTAIFQKYNLCSLVQSGAIDEIWIWTGDGNGLDKPHFWEWNTSGPGWRNTPFWSVDTPDCGRVVTTMAFNYTREADVAMESFSHRLEGFFMNYFSCDFSTLAWPWEGNNYWLVQCQGKLSDRYGFVARPFSGNSQVGGCGDAHHPPNILDDTTYIYNDQTRVQSICSDWSLDGSAQPDSINCSDWGCTHLGYHVWWMQNLPGYNNTNRDRNGESMLNWWSYLFGIPEPEPTVTPTSTTTHTPTSTTNPILVPTPDVEKTVIPPLPRPALFLPFLIAPNGQGQVGLSSTDSNLAQASAPDRPFQELSKKPKGNDSDGMVTFSMESEQPPVTRRTVFVLFYPGYGTPRAGVEALTHELIGLLREGTIYHGYNYRFLKGTFLGQDGASFAGQSCSPGSTQPDNIHIRVQGLRTDVDRFGYQIEDKAGGGNYAVPCNPAANWMIYVVSTGPDQVDLYIKPFRNAPNGTIYSVTIFNKDGTNQRIEVLGTEVHLY